MTIDQPFSILVTLLGCILCAMLPRRFALVPLALSLSMYPSNLFAPPDFLQLTPQRVIALALLVRCMSDVEIKSRFKWGTVDKVALTYFLMLCLSQMMTQSPVKAIFNRGGFFLSAMAPFWCTRMLIVDRASLYALMKGWLWGGIPVVVLGVYQSATGWNPYFTLMQYGYIYIAPAIRLSDMRMLFGHMWFRATPPFMQCIMFGWFFALLMAWTTNLYWERRSVFPWIFPWVFCPIGLLASVSGGPMMLAAVSIGLLFLFPMRHLYKFGLGLVLTAYIGAIVFSHRGPLEVLANFGFDQNSSWYRVGLQNFTLHEGMSGHWIAGYGEIPPQYGDIRFHDLCIHWVCLLVWNGLLGMVGFYMLALTCGWQLWRAKDRAQLVEDRWLLWSLMASFIASLMSMMVVALFSEMYFIYHIFLGVLANAPLLVGAATRQVGVLADVNGKTVLLRYRLQPGQQLALVRPGFDVQMPALPVSSQVVVK